MSPQIPFIKFHPGLPEKFNVFILKSSGPMMGRLIQDILFDGITPVAADGERPISILPSEFSQINAFMQPAGRQLLDVAKYVA